MKKQMTKLFGIAMLSFTFSFITGMSLSIAHLERQEMAQIQAQEAFMEETALSVTFPNTSH